MLADATGADRQALAAVLRARPHAPGPLSSILCPVLVLAGDADPLTAGADDLVSALPTARFVSVPGDHLGAVRHEAFVSAIGDFLDEVDSAGAG